MENNVRVGSRVYVPNGKFIDPHFEGFTPIIVMTPSSAYGSISPYSLVDSKGRSMENIYQFSKCYQTVPKTTQTYSRYDRRVIWSHDAETHLTQDADGSISVTKEYLAWRQKGMNAKDAIRYPVGFNGRRECLFSLAENEDGTINPTPLTYIEARKVIYLPLYTKLVRVAKQFLELKERLRQGEKLLIIEVDGPKEESLDYYKEKYGVGDDFIQGNTSVMTETNLRIFLNDPKHPFGHGYCLAAALLDINLI